MEKKTDKKKKKKKKNTNNQNQQNTIAPKMRNQTYNK